MDFVKFSLSGFDEFLIYAGLAIAFIYVYLITYLWVTPYNELKLIKDGNVAAAISLSGSVLGFTFPLATAIFQAVHPWDMMLWAVIAAAVQLLVYVAVRYSLLNVTRRIPDGQVATGVVLAAISMSAGLLNAACMTY
jgi:putative membrane protein